MWPPRAWPVHSSRKQGTVGRPSIPIHCPRIGFGNEVGFGTIQWRFGVPTACSSIQVRGSNSQNARHNLLTLSFIFSRTPLSSSSPLIASDPLTSRNADRQGVVVLQELRSSTHGTVPGSSYPNELDRVPAIKKSFERCIPSLYPIFFNHRLSSLVPVPRSHRTGNMATMGPSRSPARRCASRAAACACPRAFATPGWPWRRRRRAPARADPGGGWSGAPAQRLERLEGPAARLADELPLPRHRHHPPPPCPLLCRRRTGARVVRVVVDTEESVLRDSASETIGSSSLARFIPAPMEMNLLLLLMICWILVDALFF